MTWRAPTLAAVAASLLLIAPSSPELATTSRSHSDPAEACGKVEIHRDALEGGCESLSEVSPVRLTLVNIFGDHDFATCALEFRMHMDGDGRLGLADVALKRVAGAKSSACGDILACRRTVQSESASEKLPWRGRIVAHDGPWMIASIYICFDTCAGRFEGATRVALSVATDGRLRMRALRSAVGLSGLELTGRWMMSPLDDVPLPGRPLVRGS